MIFGDWSQSIVGEWGVLAVEANPYANFQAGIVGIRAMFTIDIALRYGEAFSVSTSVAASGTAVLSAIGSPLVAGSAASVMSTAFIRIERDVWVGNPAVVRRVGEVLEVPKHVAAGLISSGKASAAQSPAPVVEPPPVVDPAPEPKGKRNARK